MKVKAIKFFSPEENLSESEKKSKPKTAPTGYISSTGKLVFPAATLVELGIDPESFLFKIGAEQGKRLLKSIFLVPSDDQSGTFAFTKSGRGSVIPLALILKNGKIDFENNKYVFSVTLFQYQEGVVGYELALESSAPKPEYTGKPRGRKPKADLVM